MHGDSAGANLAAVVALMARDKGGPKLRLQSLVYPVADYTLSAPSYEKYATGYGLLTRAAMAVFPASIICAARPTPRTGAPRRSRRRASPGWRRPSSSPPNATYCTMTASTMPRRCGGPGSTVEYREYPGMIHAFFGMVPVVDDAMNAQRAVWAAFNRAFA